MIRLLAGDARDVLPTLPAGSVQCVVCSPPYYGLRDYGTALWDGGDAGCEHVSGVRPRNLGCVACGVSMNEFTEGCAHCKDRHLKRSIHGTPEQDYSPRDQSRPELPNPPAGWAERDKTVRGVGRECVKCGAVRVDRQIGLERDPAEYLATMVGVFQEVRRVLRRDGTCWVNMGDSYASGVGMARDQPYQRHAPQKSGLWKGTRSEKRDIGNSGVVKDGAGLKPKDLLLMPARLALALQADGWWVRSDIIWHKPNPMPESVTDRPTSAHEHVFLLTKSARYFYDADGVREELQQSSLERGYSANYLDPAHTTQKMASADAADVRANGHFRANPYVPSGRNLRNVWTIATHAYPDAHFATFPPELAERCIKAGTSERGCCAQCGKPWVRVTQASFSPDGKKADKAGPNGTGLDASSRWGGYPSGITTATTTGWEPDCKCEAGDPVPCVVLDCFAGAGTSLLVADRLQRDAIGIELNTTYTELAMERCRADAPLFTSFPPAEPPEDMRMADLFTDMAAD